MPNHVENIISLSGSEQEIQQMLKRIKSDMFGVGTVDFEKIIPMPESLNIESGTRTDRGLRAYRDFIEVYTFGRSAKDALKPLKISPKKVRKSSSGNARTSDGTNGSLAKPHGITSVSMARPPGMTGALKIGVQNGTPTATTRVWITAAMMRCVFRPHGQRPIQSWKSCPKCSPPSPSSINGRMRISAITAADAAIPAESGRRNMSLKARRKPSNLPAVYGTAILLIWI